MSEISEEFRAELKKYFVERNTNFAAEQKNEIRKIIDEHEEKRAAKTARRAQLITTIGGFSVAALVAFAWQGIKGSANTVATQQINTFIENEKLRTKERTARLQEEFNILKNSVAQIIEGRTAVELAISEAEEASAEAKSTAEKIATLRDELKASLQGQEQLQEEIKTASGAAVRQYQVIEQDLGIEIRKLSKALDDAVKKRDELEDLSDDAEDLRELSRILLASGGEIEKIIFATLQNEDIREGIVSTAAFPKGVVVAFYDQSFRERVCPIGWKPFRESEGRFVVGAGEKYIPGETGGEETVLLTESQMPNHFHIIPNAGPDTSIGQAPPGGAHGVRSRNGPDETFGTGGNQPHNNIPPYIALYFCKKD